MHRRSGILRIAVNVLLLVVVALFAWIVWQEAFSSMPSADAVKTALPGSPHSEALKEVKLDGHDVVLVYDLTGQPYFDDQARYASDFESVGGQVLDKFRRVQRVRVTILQGPEKYEGISVTDGFGKLLEWL